MHSFNRRVSVGFVLISCCLFAQSASANVLVVAAGGGGPYTQIQPAVDAANDGDTILVKSGMYAGFSVGNKALTIVGDAGADVEVQGAVQLSGLGLGKDFVLENVNAIGISSSDMHARYGLYVANNQGRIRVEACAFVGATIFPFGFDAIVIQSSLDVALLRTTGTGGHGAVLPAPQNSGSGAGLIANQSTVAIYDSLFHGGVGDSASPQAPAQDGAYGGDGCSATASTLFASGSSFTGGNGGGAGWGVGLSECYAGDGGDGIRLSSNSIDRLLNVVSTPGQGGPAGDGDGSFEGNTGYAHEASPNSGFVDFAGPSKHMVSPTPVRENSVVQLTFTGAPGDQVALLVADEADDVLVPTWKGTLLLKIHHPSWAIPIGIIPAGGTLQVPYGISDLGGLSSRVLYFQPVFVSATEGHRKLGNASGMVILNQAY